MPLTWGHTSWYTAGTVPRRWRAKLSARKTQINVYEQAAVLLALGTFAPLISNRRVLIYIDSNAALGSIVKGHSNRQDINLYAGTVWHLLAKHKITAFFMRVPSKQNPADAPSRGEFRALRRDKGARWAAPVWPQQAMGLLDTVGARCELKF